MQQYIDAVITRGGAAVAGASVLVKTYPGGVNATIYSDDGVTTTTNPLTTDSNGSFNFYAADGRYSLTISKTGVITQRTIDDILLQDPDDGTAEQSAADVTFAQSGSGAQAETIQGALRRMVFSGQYDTTANYRTARDALSQTMGVNNLQVTGALNVGVSGSTEGVALTDYNITLRGDNPRIAVWNNAGTGSAGISIGHTGSREYLLKTDTNSGGILRLGHGTGDGTISTQWLVLNGTTTQIFFGSIEALHISGTASTETVYRQQSDPTGLVISHEWFRVVDDITAPVDFERFQLVSDQVTATTFTLRTDAGGTGTVRDLEISRGSSQHILLGSTSTKLSQIVKLGTPSETNAVAGDLVLANAKEVRGANAANSGNFHLIGMDSSDRIQVGHSGVSLIVPQLAGTGTRTVVVDANGVMTAP